MVEGMIKQAQEYMSGLEKHLQFIIHNWYKTIAKTISLVYRKFIIHSTKPHDTLLFTVTVLPSPYNPYSLRNAPISILVSLP